MPEIPPDYASPLLRWALLLEDYPESTYGFDCVGYDGIPEHVRPPELLRETLGLKGDEVFCLAIITFPSDSGKPTAYAWSALSTGVKGRGGAASPVKTLEQWNTLCTKTLGRALKRAGYPDKLPELKAAILWRRRNAEIALLESGRGAMQIEQGATVEGALEATGRPSPDDVDDEEHDDEFDLPQLPDGVDPSTGEILRTQAVETTGKAAPSPSEQAGAPITDETAKAHREAVNLLAKIEGATDQLKAWAKDANIRWAKPDTEEHAQAIIDKATEIAEAPM